MTASITLEPLQATWPRCPERSRCRAGADGAEANSSEHGENLAILP
jgi:hypothetical protein